MKQMQWNYIFCFFSLIIFSIGCKQPMAPDYRGIESVTITKIGINESRVAGNVIFYNPNNFRLQLKHADVTISINDKFAGHCVIDSTIHIPKLDSFLIPVSVNIDLKNIMSNALQLLLNGKVKVNADGFVRIKKSGIGFKVPVHFEQYERVDSLMQQIH
jgi:LEA14-like dessication related protein